MAKTTADDWSTATGRAPAWSLVVGGLLSVQIGGALAVGLFRTVGSQACPPMHDDALSVHQCRRSREGPTMTHEATCSRGNRGRARPGAAAPPS